MPKSRESVMELQARLRNQRINQIVDVLQESYIGSDAYRSTDQPFFMKGPVSNFRQDFKRIPDIPDSLNRNFHYLYKIVGNPKSEVHLRSKPNNTGYAIEWTLMSLEEALDRYKELCSNDQKRIFDLAYQYLGMGHIRLLSCDLKTHNLFYRDDGGANGYERENNRENLLQLDPSLVKQFQFIDWFKHFI